MGLGSTEPGPSQMGRVPSSMRVSLPPLPSPDIVRMDVALAAGIIVGWSPYWTHIFAIIYLIFGTALDVSLHLASMQQAEAPSARLLHPSRDRQGVLLIRNTRISPALCRPIAIYNADCEHRF
jgi:hypothetical protein